MKFAHISDLHLGMRIYDRKIAEDQAYILDEIIKILKKEKPDGVFISGDIYDRPIPPEESVDMLNRFLAQIHALGQDIYMISGNHDSPERIDFGTELLESAGVYVAGKYDGHLRKITKKDEFGELDIFLMPYIKPAFVKNALREADKTGKSSRDKKVITGSGKEAEEDADLKKLDYETAVRMVLETNPPDRSRRNIILAHQFVNGATRTDSEEVLVGYVEAVSDGIFDAFDYVALGHLHKRQKIKRDGQLYCGTPLKYSFKEEKNEKSVTFVQMKEKGDVSITSVPLTPLRDMRSIRGSFEELEKGESEDYIRAVLTDDAPVPYAFNRLRCKYPNLLKLEYEHTSDFSGYVKREVDLKIKTPGELFEEFFEKCTGRKMDEEEKEILKDIV